MALPLPPSVLQLLLERFDYHRKAGRGITESYKLVGDETGVNFNTVGQAINRMRPTVGAARMYMRSKALTLARRLVKKAGPGEILDILSRPSMGVIDPAAKSEGGGGGFFLSVQAQDCGAVKIGVATQGLLPASTSEQTSETPFDPFATQSPEEMHGQVALEEEASPRPERQRFVGRSHATQSAIEAARIRLANQRAKAAGRREREQQPTGVWLAHEEPQETGGG